MNSETKQCQNCKKNFTIEPDDFGFYEKIKVPPPTFCPECRMIRQFLFRNEKNLYKHDCMVPGHDEKLISIYSPTSPMTVYDTNYWWGDKWDPISYAQEYDFSQNFFKQYHNLQEKVPRPPLVNNQAVNSEYCNFADQNKDCYLITSANRNENSFYGFGLIGNKNISDCLWCSDSELVYECIDCIKCYDLKNSQQCENCVSSAFLFDCRGCNNCLFSTHLRNKSYYVFNKQYSKEQYLEIFKDLNGDYKKYKEMVDKFDVFKKESSMRKSANILKSVNAIGDNIFSSKNINQGFDIYNSEDSSYLEEGLKAQSCYDVCFFENTELCYESISLIGYGYFFTMYCRDSRNIFYCDNCHACSECFGCVSLHKKSYCILNKQYTKEEYEKLLPKIIKHMDAMPYVDAKGRIYKYGEFFPSELSPFAYNETIAQEYFPLTKKEAIARGYKWKDKEERNYAIDIKNEDIPNDIKYVNDSVIGKVLECAHQGKCNEQCTEAFKLIPNELIFYQKMNLPLPRLCPNCRHYQRLNQRNPLKLWHRTCMCNKQNHAHGENNCDVEFETPYAPERTEIVYCEKCYQQEVY
ncbi:MAG: hypothetical protein WCW93_02895 [Candidatus Paceibacterota bacterium]